MLGPFLAIETAVYTAVFAPLKSCFMHGFIDRCFFSFAGFYTDRRSAVWPDKTLCGTIRSETKVCGRGEEVPRWQQRDWAEKRDRRRGWRDPPGLPLKLPFRAVLEPRQQLFLEGLHKAPGMGKNRLRCTNKGVRIYSIYTNA